MESRSPGSQGSVKESGNLKFSVVMPLYNKEKSVARAIASVMSQTCEDFELIVVDDGSTDDSLSVASRFSDSRVRVLSKENGGASSARNFGLNLCDGEFVAFLDADDEWDNEFLATIEQLVRKFPDALIYSTGYMNRESGKPDSRVIFRDTMDSATGEILQDYFRLIHKKGASINNSSTSVVRLSFFREGLSFPEKMRSYEDHAVWYRLALRGDVAYAAKALVCIYKDSENRSNASWNPARAVDDLAELGRTVDQYGKQHLLDQEKYQQFAALMRYRERYLLRMLLRTGSFECFRKVIRECSHDGVMALGSSRPGFLLLRSALYTFDIVKQIARAPRQLMRRLGARKRTHAQKA